MTHCNRCEGKGCPVPQLLDIIEHVMRMPVMCNPGSSPHELIAKLRAEWASTATIVTAVPRG